MGDVNDIHTQLLQVVVSTGNATLFRQNIYIAAILLYVLEYYSGTPLNGHPSTTDTHDITDSSEIPDRFSIDFNTLKTPELRTPRYSV